MRMKVAVRADAALRIGSGHVMRCLTLADELRLRGAEVTFLSRPQPGDAGALIAARGYRVMPLGGTAAAVPRQDGDPPHADWLGCTWQEDLEESRRALAEGDDADWLVVDHYALDARWEGALRRQVGRILVIDDLADRNHDCDLLLDQNLQTPDRYARRVPATCRQMLGPRHALLRPTFRRPAGSQRRRDGSVRRGLVFFGGGDPADITGRAVDAWQGPRTRDLPLDVVVGAAYPHRERLAARCQRLPHFRLHVQVEDMAALMVEADLALGGTGVTTWERAALGLPALTVSLADNQRPIARAAAAAGILTWLGDGHAVSDADWRQAIAEAIASPDRLLAQSAAGHALVDGRGAERVVEAMQ